MDDVVTSVGGGGPDDTRPDAAVRQLLFRMLEDPSRETYLPVWQAVTSSPAYDPYAGDLRQLEQLFQQDQYAEVMRRAYPIMGRWLLTPRIHFLLGFSAKQLGDEQTAELERIIGAACVQAILGTGDGSEERPYLVTSTTDEYDILLHLGKELGTQALLERPGRTLDRMECTDGTVLHFDITAAYARLLRKPGPAGG